MKQEATRVARPMQFNQLYERERYRVWKEYAIGPGGMTRRRARTQMRLDRSVPLERLVTIG